MANEIKKVNESYTEFGVNPAVEGGYTPQGALGRFFFKFFAKRQTPVKFSNEIIPDVGDTVVSPETIKFDTNPASPEYSKNNNPIFPPIEMTRRARYREYEEMDNYPEISSAFDIFADDCTQKNIDNALWKVDTEDNLAREEIEALFKRIKLDRFYWDITRNTVKYGDCFIEIVVDLDNPKKGIQKLKILDPNFIYRKENIFGYLEGFLQEIPDKKDFNTYGFQSNYADNNKFIPLDKDQIVHFRLHTSDKNYYPYGKSIASACRQVFRSLKVMEDAMLIYRLSRAPERRIFYIDVGGLPSTKAEAFIDRLKEKFKKEKMFDRNTGQLDNRYNPMAADEDFFVPRRGANEGTKIEALPGAQNLGEVDDVKYFRDKLLAALKIPKDYIVEKDKSPERKANLSQLDVKFARTILRIQRSIEVGMESIAKRHLHIKGFPEKTVNNLRIKLPDPSDMMTKRRMDVDEQKVRVVQAILGLQLFPREKIYKEYYDLNDQEIEELEKKLEKEQKKLAQQQMALGGMPGQPGDGNMPDLGGGGATPIVPGVRQDEPGYNDAGGQEGAENKSPTSNEGKIQVLTNLRKHLISEGANPKAINILNQTISKIRNKNIS